MTDNLNNERILTALRDARQKLEAADHARFEPIAIIGMAGRFPGAENTDELWKLLADGRPGIRFLSDQELEEAGVSPELYSQPEYVRAWASFDAPAAFDAAFFGYSPREAELLDPQHRVFLECAWHALEHAGYDSLRYNGDIGVFAGAALNSYVINLHNDSQVRQLTDTVQAVVSNVLGLMPTRASYHLNLTGPSCGIQTGCSTSLVAIHQACQSLRADECQMALAGGVTISDAMPHGYLYQEGSIASQDGHCRAFDADGKGTVFGNGVGVVVLKRLSRAQSDGDCILAVIRGSAVNNDGRDKVGLIAPSVNGQANVIRAALRNARVEPASIGAIEAHGTGTDLGDPIEITALNKALQSGLADSDQVCLIGSVKTNLGHLDAAAGVTGLIKMILALQHKKLPASLHFQRANPQIDFAAGSLRVNSALQAWPAHNSPRRAGVSSFGMGGTNAHLILEEAPAVLERIAPLPSRRWQVLPLSARTDTALDSLTTPLATRVHGITDGGLSNVAFTLQQGRRPLPRRRVVIADSGDAASAALAAMPVSVVAGSRPVVFMFPGQGSQRLNTTRFLYQSEPVYRQALDQCAELLGDRVPLLELLFPEREDSAANNRLRQTANAQPVLFAVEYALAQLWQHWGVQPSVLIGHSVGEYVAACLAGVFSLADAIALVATRGELMQSCAPGRMLAVMRSETELLNWLQQHDVSHDCEIVAVNGPTQCVLGGTEQTIERALQTMEQQGIPATLLRTSHAFHSVSMEPAAAAFKAAVASVQRHAPVIDVISNVTGEPLTAEQATDPAYWATQLRICARFGDGLQWLAEQGDSILLEVGPGDSITRIATKTNTIAQASIAGEDEEQTLAIALGKLWQVGVDIDWAAYAEGRPGQRTGIPLYPFERETYWVPLQQSAQTTKSAAIALNDSKQADPSLWFYRPVWRSEPPQACSSETMCEGHWLVLSDSVLPYGIAAFPCAQVTYLNWTQSQTDPHMALDDAFAKAKAESSEINRVIFLLSQHVDDFNAHELNVRAQTECRALVRLIQSVHVVKSQNSFEFTLITQGACAVTSAGNGAPAASVYNALLQVATQELTAWTFQQIDLDAALSLHRQWPDLYDELLSLQQQKNRLVVLRNGARWLREYQPLLLPKATVPDARSLLKQHGNYLVAGDLAQGLGMVIAQGLHQHHQARLLLCDSGEVPDASHWEQWLATHGPRHPVSLVIRTVQTLRLEGADIQILKSDLSSESGWRDVLSDHGIQGIFLVDAMGDQSSCPLPQLDAAEQQRIFGQRIQRVQALSSTLSQEDHSLQPDFVVVQSSLSTVAGGQGFGAYAAANAVVDNLVIQHAGDTPWLTLNWDAVDTDVMAFKQGSVGASGSRLMKNALTVAEAWEVMERVLARARHGQIVVSPRCLQSRLLQAFAPLDVVTDVPANDPQGRPLLETPYVAPRSETERMVVAALGELLGIGKVGVDDDFFDLGGQSLLAIQAVTRLRKEFGVELPMRSLLFEARTAAGIASVIDKAHAVKVQSDNDALESLLAEVENLTPEEAAQQLE